MQLISDEVKTKFANAADKAKHISKKGFRITLALLILSGSAAGFFEGGRCYQGYLDSNQIEDQIDKSNDLDKALWDLGLYQKQGYTLDIDGSNYNKDSVNGILDYVNNANPNSLPNIAKGLSDNGAKLKVKYKLNLVNGVPINFHQIKKEVPVATK